MKEIIPKASRWLSVWEDLAVTILYFLDFGSWKKFQTYFSQMVTLDGDWWIPY